LLRRRGAPLRDKPGYYEFQCAPDLVRSEGDLDLYGRKMRF
jgi:hypothetical protein